MKGVRIASIQTQAFNRKKDFLSHFITMFIIIVLDEFIFDLGVEYPMNRCYLDTGNKRETLYMKCHQSATFIESVNIKS